MAYTGTKSQVGRGSVLSIGTTPVVIGEVKSSGITGSQWGTVDVTNFDSGADQEFLTTIRNNGELNLMVNRVSSDAGQTAVEAAYGTGAITPFTLQLPKTGTQTVKGDTYAFNALVVSRDFSVEVEKEIALTIKLKISGAVTLTAGS